MSVIVAVLFVAVVAGIAWLFPTVLFMFKNAYAVRGLPKHPKEHWFFGHMPYVVGCKFTEIRTVFAVIIYS